MTNNQIHLLIQIIVTLPFLVSCQKKEEYIQVVIQPELVVNETFNFEIYFKEIPDYGTLKIENSDLFELNDSPHTSIKDSIGNKDTKRHFYITYITPLREGNLTTPKVSAMFKGVEHTSSPMAVISKKDIEVKENAVLLELKSNKRKYHLKDTIRITLYEYSRFNKLIKTTIQDTISFSFPKIKGVDEKLIVEMETTFFDITGIEDLEDYIYDNFEVVDWDWDPFKEMQTMETKGNDMYIKNLLIKLVLLPKNKGEFSINKSSFKYAIYNSNTDYFNRFVPNDNGRYSVTDGDAKKTIVSSNSLNFEVK